MHPRRRRRRRNSETAVSLRKAAARAAIRRRLTADRGTLEKPSGIPSHRTRGSMCHVGPICGTLQDSEDLVECTSSTRGVSCIL